MGEEPGRSRRVHPGVQRGQVRQGQSESQRFAQRMRLSSLASSLCLAQGLESAYSGGLSWEGMGRLRSPKSIQSPGTQVWGGGVVWVSWLWLRQAGGHRGYRALVFFHIFTAHWQSWV